MSILIQLDQKESKELFKPGGKVKIIMSNCIIYGFLFKWVDGETVFFIINPATNDIRKIDYFRCQQIWYTPAGKETSKFKKALKSLQDGQKIKKELSPDHANQLKFLIQEIDSLPS